MKKGTKAWLVAAACLVLAGCALFAGVMTALGWDFLALATVRYETNIHEIREDFDRLSLDVATADVTLAPSEDGLCRVECYETEKEGHTVTVEKDTLTVRSVNEKTMLDFVEMSFSSPKITVYLPKKEYAALSVRGATGDVKMPAGFQFGEVEASLSTGNVTFCAAASGTVDIRTGTGAIVVENASAGAFRLAVSTGTVTVSNGNCAGETAVEVTTGRAMLTDFVGRSIVSRGKTGDAILKNVAVAEKIAVERTTGDVRLTRCDAGELSLKTDTGDVEGTLLSEKVFVVHSDTGRVEVPPSGTGGKCAVCTDTGDIRLELVR